MTTFPHFEQPDTFNVGNCIFPLNKFGSVLPSDLLDRSLRSHSGTATGSQWIKNIWVLCNCWGRGLIVVSVLLHFQTDGTVINRLTSAFQINWLEISCLLSCVAVSVSAVGIQMKLEFFQRKFWTACRQVPCRHRLVCVLQFFFKYNLMWNGEKKHLKVISNPIVTV